MVRGFRVRRAPTRVEETLPLPFSLPSVGHDVFYILKRSSARRTLALRVSDQGEIAVNAPLRLAQGEVDRFLFKHADWLRARMETVRSQAFHWRDGAELPWRGGSLILVLRPTGGCAAVRLEKDTLVCRAEPERVEAAVRHWYQRQARPLLAERLAYHAARVGRAESPMRLSDARTRWGSLSPKGVVSLNWRLVKADTEEMDYVICHELAHFRQRNHSPAFWREVAALYPDYLLVRARLRANGHRYFEF